MSEDLSTQLPNSPELQPITTTSSKIWRSVSIILTFGGLALIGAGGWIFIQQQIEANKPPPARILEVSVPDFESSEPEMSNTVIESANSFEAEVPAVSHQSNDNVPVREAVSQPTVSTSTLEENIELQEEVSTEFDPSVAHSIDKEALSPAEARLLEQSVPSQEEPALSLETTTTESPLSLADNPLPVVEDESDAVAATESNDSTETTEDTEKSLTRIVAESIGLDADVIEVGWESMVQNGVAMNVWVVADYAAGWHKNSKLPGQGGNIVMSAHHNIKGEVFRYTLDLEPGDIVTLYDEGQSYDYVVEDKFIIKDKGEPEAVRRENAKWIGPFDEERLTLVTCWPYNSNSHRLIVIAKPAGEEQALTQ